MQSRLLRVVMPLALLAGMIGMLSIRLARAQTPSLIFAVIGDYGTDNAPELSVANMVKSWHPDLIITTGDNYYSNAGGSGSKKYDESTGAYFCAYLKDINTAGTRCPTGLAQTNLFFPALGNHDYTDAGTANQLPTTYTSYFTLPGTGYVSSSNNERYYDFIAGPVHFFVINSHNKPGSEPDGTGSTSIQSQWLHTQLAASTSTWNIVYFHHPPYSSGRTHGSSSWMQWPFAQWGADAVLNGHEHGYERIARDGIVYMVNGIGGSGLYAFTTPVPGSIFRYAANYGAQKVTASGNSITFELYSIDNGGTLLDTYTITANASATATPTTTATPTITATPTTTAIPTITPTRTPVPTAGPKTVIFNSDGAFDGRVLESAENSNVGGSVNTTATTFRLGDDALNRQYKAILSFNTASLPDNASIQSVVLKIKQAGVPIGSNPFNVLGNLFVDIRKGAFGAADTLTVTDFQATPSAARVATFSKTPAAGWYSATLNLAGRNNINNVGVTQFRLYFTKDDNNDLGADFMKFVSGNNAMMKPQLIITYTVP